MQPSSLQGDNGATNKPKNDKQKTSIMPISESIMWFYREAFAISLVAVLCNLILMCNKKLAHAHVTVYYKRLVISHTWPLSTIVIIARRTFLLVSLSFSLHPPSHWPADCQHITCSILLGFYSCSYRWPKSEPHLSWRYFILCCQPYTPISNFGK